MMTTNKTDKARGWLSRVRLAVAVGKTVLTGRAARSLDRADRGVEIAEKAAEIIELLKQKK